MCQFSRVEPCTHRGEHARAFALYTVSNQPSQTNHLKPTISNQPSLANHQNLLSIRNVHRGYHLDL